jgi:uncharacterized membrane protein YbhN (UPF0104 family)
MTEPVTAGAPPGRPGFVKRFVLPLLRLFVVGFTVFILVRLIRDVDFGQVWDAVKTLTWVQIFVLLLLLLVVRTLSAVPMSRFIPALSVQRSLYNDLAANLMSTVAPPPGDMLIRYSMFNAWGISRLAGVVGVTLNTLMFYVVKCSGPVLGLALLLVTHELGGGPLWTTAVSALAAAALLATVAAAIRAERLAAAIGRTGGRAAHRFRPASVDPEAWAAKMVEFRGLVGEQLREGWLLASLAGVGMLVADASLLVYSLRSVGVPGSAIGALAVIGGFLVAYPLTALPFSGIGVFDGFLYAFVIARTGSAYDPAVVAGLVIWRSTTLLVAYLAGGICLLTWRRRASEPAAGSVTAQES